MKITLIGMGPGRGGTAFDAWDKIHGAGHVIGSERVIRELSSSGIAATALSRTRDIVERIRGLEKEGCPDCAVLFSGDTGFHSGASVLLKALKEEKAEYQIEVIPGISSLQIFAARLQKSWQDWVLASAHGMEYDYIKKLSLGFPVFLLTGGGQETAGICQTLSECGLGSCMVTVGEDLTYPDEKIRAGKACEMAGEVFRPLNVMLIEPDPALIPRRCVPGIPDGEWIRGRIPMTKQEIRAAALAKLAVSREDICWDIGAGTGSVAVEMALAARQAWAVERDPEACELIEKNRSKFCAFNLHIVQGTAPEALGSLPAPDAVFVGGTGGNMAAILDCISETAKEARICISAVSLENLQLALNWMKEHGREPEVCQISVSRSSRAGDLHLLLANNPVFLVSWRPDG